MVIVQKLTNVLFENETDPLSGRKTTVEQSDMTSLVIIVLAERFIITRCYESLLSWDSVTFWRQPAVFAIVKGE